ncbi:tetratricopeptide repeat protein [Crenothrix sp.]|uniref:tetratricopeptide repeat protein n=1 Tax=Crenothrix sp. TaxID=3100433 RepID=UPI00374D3E53
MYKKIIHYVFLVILLNPCYLQAKPLCDQWFAKIVSVQGQVDVKYYTQPDWELAHQNGSLCFGDSIRTGKYGRVVLKFTNEALTTLDQSSTLILPDPKRESTSWFIDLIEGRGFFRSRHNQELDIHTPFLNAVHKGTEFLVTVNNDKTTVSVFDGSVSAENKAGHILATQGFSAEAERNQPPKIRALTVTPENAVQWALYYPPIADYQSQKLSSVEPQLQPALTAYQQGNLSTALALLNNLPESQRDANTSTFTASLLLTVGRLDEAQPHINQALKLEPNNSTAMGLQAIIAVAQNQHELALQQAQKAVAINPKSEVAQIALSYAYQSQFKVEEALKSAQIAAALAPNNALAWARLSELQLSVCDRDAALESAQKAQTLNPDLARIHTIKGFAELADNNINNGKQAFTQAISIDSSDPIAYLGLGLAKIRQGQLEEGKSDLEIAVNLDPNNSILRSYLGKSFYELKNKEFAGKEFDIAKTVDNKDPTPWFYDAILKQTTNRPVEALHDMQKAIELNDNRGVYRSKLLLDEDKAVRSASLGRIYKELGFDDVARQQATISLTVDPSNYSAHRLLADSYLYRPRQEIARASEILQAQLLQPLNYNPIQPQLAYTDLNIPKSSGFADTSFNEYSRLFEGNQHRLTATGLYGSNDTRADEAVLSGIHNKFAYSLGQMHYQTDGFRSNADLKHNLYNVFGQYEFSPQLSMQAEYRYRDTEQGDIQMTGSATNSDKNFRRNLQQSTYRLGAKYSPAQHSDLLFSYIYADRHEDVKGLELTTFYNGNANHHGYQFEAQYLYHSERFNSVIGGGSYQSNNNRLFNAFIPQFNRFISTINDKDYENNQNFGYIYTHINLLKNIVATTGLSYDNYLDDLENANFTISQLSPKLGLQWQINKALTLRIAGFQTVKAPIVINQLIQPMQVAGFNQFFDDPNGTRATQYGVGVDMHPTNNFYMGAEAYKRDLNVPSIDTTKKSAVFSKQEQELYRLYFNWLPHVNWQLNSEMRFESFRGQKQHNDYQSVESGYIPLNVRYFNTSGFFADVTGQFVHQSVLGGAQNLESFKSNFILLDAAVGYRFPKQYGMISLEAKNLLDKNFKYRDRSYQMNEYRASDLIPERLLFARLTLNF